VTIPVHLDKKNSMNINAITPEPRSSGRSSFSSAIVIATAMATATLVIVFRDGWLPLVQKNGPSHQVLETPEATHDDPHAGHGHAAHQEANSLELSPQARKNIGLSTAPIKLQTFVRSVSMPALVVGKPGRSCVEVTAPLGGRVTRIYPIEGCAVEPGQPLFNLRLTHEDLVDAQGEFLRSAEELDVVDREIIRLKSIALPGAIPGKRKLEREYERQKIKAGMNAQRQSLLLHGLTLVQVKQILETRELVQEISVVTPKQAENGHDQAPLHPFTLKRLDVKKGQYVDAGKSLCLLMDYSDLYIEGRAFQQDADHLLQAARGKWDISATRTNYLEQSESIQGLKIVYVDSEVDPESRVLHFYIGLPNTIIHESKTPDRHRFIAWQYKLGQRMQVRIPVEQYPERIVLPVDGVVKEGAENYVFLQNGRHFNRVPVQVEFRDQLWTVIANDGSVFPGDVVVTSGAYQLQMALKNKAGGGLDPHAGHSH
jgi:multidrug efflux pump subunit AcrA (membrane-fusion protein)